MDCRRSLVSALVLAGAVVGCTQNGTLPVAPNQQEMANVTGKKAPDLPKRKPQASTCVAFGQFREQQASTDKSPTEQAQLRDDARKAYQQALDLDPKHLGAAQALARLYVTIEDFDRAAATYQKALKQHPKEASLWFDFGMCQARQKQWQPAVECLGKAAELDPENRQYTNALGYCLARCGRSEESFACFEKAVGTAKAHYNLARMHHHLKEDDQSKARLRLAIQADPKLTVAAELLAQLESGAAPGQEAANVSYETLNP